MFCGDVAASLKETSSAIRRGRLLQVQQASRVQLEPPDQLVPRALLVMHLGARLDRLARLGQPVRREQQVGRDWRGLRGLRDIQDQLAQPGCLPPGNSTAVPGQCTSVNFHFLYFDSIHRLSLSHLPTRYMHKHACVHAF